MANLEYLFEQEIAKYRIHTEPQSVLTAIHISLKHNYLYVSTPKVACSTIKATLHKLELDDPNFSRDDLIDVHKPEFSPLLNAKQIGSFDHFLKKKNLFKFCFSRNPYARLLSVYLEKICGDKPQKRRILMYLGKDFSVKRQEISFKDFVEVVCNQPVLDMNTHWKLQYFQTMQDSIDYDFIGKMESFNDDFSQVINRFCSNSQVYFQNENSHSTNASEFIKDYYCETTINLVRDKFLKDFEYFGYSTDINLV